MDSKKGYQIQIEFKQVIRSRFKDYIEKKTAYKKFRWSKQIGRLNKYISYIQSFNLVAGYLDTIE